MPSKKFKTKEEFNWWIQENFSPKSVQEMLTHQVTSDEIIKKLVADGYTDLDNLVEDGHAYQIGEHTNNGWLYEDEVDLAYIGNRKLKKRIM